MRPLSVVIITFNEERNIARCLASVREIADDIVVLDSFSTDRTEAIVRAAGARFFQHRFNGHIEQKNLAITHALNPFILSLDADEALDERLQRAVQAAKAGSADGYTMNRLTNYCGTWIKHGGWYPDRKLRLWDSRKGAWGGSNPHDRYILKEGSSTEHLEGDILHYAFTTVEEHKRQAAYFSELAAKAKYAKGKRGSLLKVLFAPVVKFVWDYIFRLGFLDGYHGFVIARISAHAKYLRYTKLRALSKHADR